MAESEHLIRLVAARTGLSLREVAPAFMQSKRFGGSAEALVRDGMPPALAGAVVASRRRLWARFWMAICLTAIPILAAMGLLFTARHWVEPYQPAYLATYPQTIHAGPRLFSDSMALDVGNWPVQVPSDGNGSVAKQFVDGAYQVTLPSPSRSVSLTKGDYGDAAVEVTVTSNGSGSAGLVLRATDIVDSLVFDVDAETGFWELAELRNGSKSVAETDAGTLAIGHSDAIHASLGATNRLLIVIHRQSAVLYVNGQLVGIVGNAYDLISPSHGQVGVFADGAGVFRFSDFAVDGVPG